jgi:hypothetical protein
MKACPLLSMGIFKKLKIFEKTLYEKTREFQNI